MLDTGTRNVVRLSVSFMLLFFAYMSQEFIQEPLIEAEHRRTGEIDPHAGYHSFAILYFFFTIACLLITPIVEVITAKWSMVIGFIAYVIFQAGFAFLNSYYLYITSAILGVGASFLWVGQGKYLTENCTGKTIERNTALTWLIFKFSLLGGGIFLFFMFQHKTMTEMVQTGEYKVFVYIFCTISFLGCLNTCFLPQSAYMPEKKEKETLAQTLRATFKIMRQPPMLLLAFIFLYTGFSRSFWIAIYPTCIKFTTRLGENTTKLLAISCIATGIGQIFAGGIFSIIGKRARILGKDWICVIACFIHLGIFVAIFLFFPADAPLHPTDKIGYFEPSVHVAIVCSGLLGFGDAIIQTQVYSYLCDGYSEESSHAFALFKFYSAISSTIAFFISKYFTLTGHLVLYGTFAILSGVTAVMAQRMYFHKTQHFFQEFPSYLGSVLSSAKMLSPQTINILRLSIGVMIQFTAILSHEFIMEPLLHGFAHLGIGGIQDKDGYLSLCIIYLFNTLSCLISTWLVTKVTGKWAMVIGMVTVLCFQLSYLFPSRYGILLISMVVGVGTTFFWVGHGQYVSENVTNKNREQITSLQWAFFKGSLIIGGFFFFFYFKNSSIEDIVKTGQVKTFLYIFMGCSIFSIINTSLVPQSEMSQAREPQEFLESTKHCWKLMKTSKILCLSIFFFYTGLIRSFWISIYPACIKFTKIISTNTTSTMTMGMIVTGVGQVFASILVSILGPRIRKVGAFVFILLALFIHCTCFLGISLTFPNEAPLGPTDKGGPVFEASQTTAMIYSFFLGFGDAILQTQVYSYVAKHYQKDSSMVFSVFRCASGIASTTLFFAAQYFYLIIHLLVLAVFACAAGFAIVVFEIRSGRMYHQKSTISVVEVIPRGHSSISSFNRN